MPKLRGEPLEFLPIHPMRGKEGGMILPAKMGVTKRKLGGFAYKSRSKAETPPKGNEWGESGRRVAASRRLPWYEIPNNFQSCMDCRQCYLKAEHDFGSTSNSRHFRGAHCKQIRLQGRPNKSKPPNPRY